MKAIKATPRYQHRLKQLKAEAEAAAAAADASGKGGKKGGKGKGKKGAPAAAIDDKELEKLIDVNVHGGYSKPKVEEILLVWLALLPLELGKHLLRQGEWVYKYRVLKQPYDHEAQLLLTCQKARGHPRGLGLAAGEDQGPPPAAAALDSRELQQVPPGVEEQQVAAAS